MRINSNRCTTYFSTFLFPPQPSSKLISSISATSQRLNDNDVTAVLQCSVESLPLFPSTISSFLVTYHARLIKSPSISVLNFLQKFSLAFTIHHQPANLFFASIIGIDKNKSKMKRRASRAERRAFSYFYVSLFLSLWCYQGGLDGRYPWGHVISYLMDRDDGCRFRCVLSFTGSLSGMSGDE
jgi:hypothetical protein